MQILVCVSEFLCPKSDLKAPKPKVCLGAQKSTTKMLRQAARIMKITAILILGACLHVNAAGFGQKISLSETDAPIESVFKKIERQTNFKFLYSDHVIKDARHVTIKVENAQINDVLSLIFKDQILNYEINKNTVLVIPGKKALVASDDPIELRGVVTDNEGKPLAGANVKIKGTAIGTTTDSEGRFFINGISENDVIEISFVGHESKFLNIKDKHFLSVTLLRKQSVLDETLVIAYGTTTKRFNTGNVGTVKASDIEKQPVNNLLLALQARVPSLVITQNTGVPGGGIKVRIQGQNNIGQASGSEPFYVVDGVPYVSQMLSTFTGGPQGGILGNSDGPIGSGGGSPLSYINPDDIESVEILKDADATAIYGSRAANGAILITTKKGKAGQAKINFNIQNGWGKVTRNIDLLNTQEYLEMRREAFKNDGAIPSITNAPDLLLWDTTRYTDWQKELIGKNAQYTHITGGVSGGSNVMQYLVSGTYHRETTVFPGNFDDQKGSMHVSLNCKSANQRFQMQFNGTYLIDNNQLPAVDFTSTAIGLAPNAPPIYNTDGSLNWAQNPSGTSTWNNPLSATQRIYENKANNLIGNAIVAYKIFSGAELSSSFGYTNLQAEEFQAFPISGNSPETRPLSTRNAWYTNSNINSWIIEPQFNYRRKFGFGKLETLVGATVQQRNSRGQGVIGKGFNSDQVMRDMLSATTIQVLGTENAVYKYNALFARINYNWIDKYIINLTMRRDGSSRFGSRSQFHNFGAIGIAWLFGDEKWIKNNFSFLSFGKIRASYGTTGSDQISDYRFLNLYRPISSGVGFQGSNGLEPAGLANPYIEWEETRKFQVGVDLNFLNERINLTTNYVLNRTSNHLLDYVLPTITGFGGITENFPAIIRNRAWEFILSSTNVKSNKLTWRTTINFTLPNNKVVDFPNFELTSYGTGGLGVIPGQPLGVMKVYHFLGVDPSTGIYQFADSRGNATTSPTQDDRTVLVNSQPIYYGGLQNTFEFKGFQLDFLIQYSKQNGTPYLFRTVPGRFASGLNNQPNNVLTRWQKPGDETTIQRFSTTTNLLSSYFNAVASDLFFSDASYVRLKNISLSWNLPNRIISKIRLNNFRLYVQGQNLITITNFKGLDPENRSALALPPLRVLTAGIQVTL